MFFVAVILIAVEAAPDPALRSSSDRHWGTPGALSIATDVTGASEPLEGVRSRPVSSGAIRTDPEVDTSTEQDARPREQAEVKEASKACGVEAEPPVNESLLDATPADTSIVKDAQDARTGTPSRVVHLGRSRTAEIEAPQTVGESDLCQTEPDEDPVRTVEARPLQSTAAGRGRDLPAQPGEGWLMHASFGEMAVTSTAGPMGMLLGGGRSCWLWIMIVGVFMGVLACMTQALKQCFNVEEGWYHNIICLRPLLKRYYKFEEFTGLVCIHRLKLDVKEDSNANYCIRVLTRQSGKGNSKPTKSMVDPKSKTSDAVQTRSHKTLPENVKITISPHRPEVQLAVYKMNSTRFSKDETYVGSVSFDVNKFSKKKGGLEVLPRDGLYNVMDNKGKTVGRIAASFYKDSSTNQEIVADLNRDKRARIPISCRAMLDVACDRLRENAQAMDARRTSRTPSPMPSLMTNFVLNAPIPRMEALAHILTGNFLAVGAKSSGGSMELKYFEMKMKKTAQKWFWVWYQKPHFGDDSQPASENLMEGYIPLRSISAVDLVPANNENHVHSLIVRYHRKEHGQRGEVFLAVHGPKKPTSTFFDCVRGRQEIAFALRAMREDTSDEAPKGTDEGSNSGDSDARPSKNKKGSLTTYDAVPRKSERAERRGSSSRGRSRSASADPRLRDDSDGRYSYP